MKSKIELPNYLTEVQKNNILNAIKYDNPIIIKGKEGVPTGKTTLYNMLKSQGIEVFEIYDCVEIELNDALLK